MLISALFTIARTWKQPKYPSIDEWIKMWYIYTMEYYSAIKKNKTMSFAALWIQLEIITLHEVRKTKTNTIQYHLYVKYILKKKQTNKDYRTETDSQT